MYRGAYNFDTDGPSTSAHGMDQQKKDNSFDDDDAPKERPPEEEAFEDMVEKVSVAGWKEAFGEKITWISHVFKVALLVLSACSLYYSYGSARQWYESGYKDEISDFVGLNALPMSNVTICAQVYYNQTFIRDYVYVPPVLLERYMRVMNQTEEKFYEQLTLFLTVTVRQRNLNFDQTSMFYIIYTANPKLFDYVSFVDAATLPCEKMFRKCSFNGQEFDCCEIAVKSFDDDGICYQLPFNRDTDNAVPDPSTTQHTRTGPAGGLSVEVSVPVKDFPWLDEDADNGFRVYVDHVPESLRQTPMVAPHGAETFIRVTPTKRKLAKDCSPHGHLSNVDKLLKSHYYDPMGHSCGMRELMDTLQMYGQCHLLLYTYRPNASTHCTPNFLYSMSSMFSSGDAEKSIGKSDKFSPKSATGQLERAARSFLSPKSYCPYHCEYWTYDSKASFVYLEPTSQRSAMEDKTHIRGIIHVYYHELAYRQYEETKEETLYFLFCDLGNVWSFYWGMSIVSFFHVFFYLTRYLYFSQKAKKAQQPPLFVKVRKIKVRPLDVETTAV